MVEINILGKLKKENQSPKPETYEESISTPALLKDYHTLKAICSHPLLLKQGDKSSEDSDNSEEESSEEESGSENIDFGEKGK